jgi:hypothetical protein
MYLILSLSGIAFGNPSIPGHTIMPTLRYYRIEPDATGNGTYRVEVAPPPPPPPPGVRLAERQEEEEVLPPMPPLPGQEVPIEAPSASSAPPVSGDRAGPAPAAALLPDPPSSTKTTAAAAYTIRRRSQRRISPSTTKAAAAAATDRRRGRRPRTMRRMPRSAYTESRGAASNAPSNGCGRSVGAKRKPNTVLWDLRYGEFIEYKERHGDCLVPFQYGPNKPLGQWVCTQRTQYRLLQQGKQSSMTEERITKLEAIGFVWDASHVLNPGQVDDEAWNQRFGELIEYKQKHDEANKQLRRWVHYQRTQCLWQSYESSSLTLARRDLYHFRMTP